MVDYVSELFSLRLIILDRSMELSQLRVGGGVVFCASHGLGKPGSW